MESGPISTPPVNNALLPDIYNKLDADLQERTRVINTQLDKRLMIQERVLNRYKRTAERLHNEEAVRIRQELARISTRLPAVGNIRNFHLGYFTRKKKQTKKMRGIPEEKVFMPFCERNFIHHLPTKKKFYRKSKGTPVPPNMVDGAKPHDVATVNGSVTVRDSVVADRDGHRTDDSLEVQSDVQLKTSSQRVLPASR